MKLVGLIDQNDDLDVLEQAISIAINQCDKLIVYSSRKIEINNIEVLGHSLDGPHHLFIKYGLQNKYDFLYIISSNSFLDNGCIDNNINFLKNWNELYGTNCNVSAVYSDVNLRLSNDKLCRQYLESLTSNRIMKNELIIDNLLVDLNKIAALNIIPSQVKSNEEFILGLAYRSIVLHNPLPTHSVKYRAPNNPRDIKTKYGSLYL